MCLFFFIYFFLFIFFFFTDIIRPAPQLVMAAMGTKPCFIPAKQQTQLSCHLKKYMYCLFFNFNFKSLWTQRNGMSGGKKKKKTMATDTPE